jgi:septal ring factor EnvC (AmiA/AmiB activator)
MAKEPDDAVVPILQQIQATLAQHGRLLADHSKSFKRIETEMREMNESMLSALGLAAHSNVRHEDVKRQIEELTERVERLDGELRARVERLEEKV